MKNVYIKFLNGNIENKNSSVLLSPKKNLSCGLYCFYHEALKEVELYKLNNNKEYKINYIK